MSRTKEIAFQLSRQASGINPSAPEYTGPPEHWTEAVTRLEAENAVQAEEIARLREALTTIADSDMPICNSCEGEGNRYADGKAHYYSEHAPTIPCSECYGVGRIPELTANDMRELADAALKSSAK